MSPLQAKVLAAAPLQGHYVLPLGAGPGRWVWFAKQEPVTRQVNVLLRAGLLKTDAEPAGCAGQHPERKRAVAVAVERVDEPAHVVALRAALPIVQRAAAMAPTTLARMERQREAARTAGLIEAVLAAER